MTEWPRPTNMFEIHKFLGFAGYYKCFVEHFLKIATPMTRLLQKKVHFNWSNCYEQSFQELKKWLVTVSVLTLLVADKEFIVYCDASIQGLGCVLMQEDRVVTYA